MVDYPGEKKNPKPFQGKEFNYKKQHMLISERLKQRKTKNREKTKQRKITATPR